MVDDIDAAADMSDRLAVEHVEVMVKDPIALGKRLKHYGGLFVGEGAAEVLGDYGAGPNHTLPTGGTARSTGGLSVFTFLRVRTWMRVDDRVAANEMVQDCVRLGEMEGLFGHAAAARRLLEGGAEASRAGPGGMSPLWQACYGGYFEAARALVEGGADVGQVDGRGAAPLKMACQNGHVDVARMLIEKGADVGQARKNGATPLTIAKQQGHAEIARLLEARGRA